MQLQAALAYVTCRPHSGRLRRLLSYMAACCCAMPCHALHLQEQIKLVLRYKLGYEILGKQGQEQRLKILPSP